MHIIADSGSTKCTWLLTDGRQRESVLTRGINAVQFTEEQIAGVLAELPVGTKADSVRFYGAGCGSTYPEASGKLRRALESYFGTSDIGIESDLTGAARALFGAGEGIACILGTGSNSGWYRNGEIGQNVPPLGYILGDEGSGAVLGRNLLNGIFKGRIPLLEEFHTAYRLEYEQIISRVYREPHANRFLASLAPFVLAFRDRPEVDAMVRETFRDFARNNLGGYPAGLPVGFVGGIAAHFEQPLREVMRECGFEVSSIVESPAEGLLKYHYGA